MISILRIAKACFPGHHPRDLYNRGRLACAGLANRRQLATVLDAPSESALGLAIQERPELLGLLIWPYQNADWGVRDRIERFAGHYRVIDQLGPPFPFSVEMRLVLHDLGDLYPGLKIVLDQPRWFMREGGLTVNLFVDSFRAYSVAFSLYDSDDCGREAYIGAMQGRDREGAIDLYRELTRAMHGLRPRDMTIEVVRMFCRHFSVDSLFGVADDVRHHRHSYFGKTEFTQNYDEVWEDRGGTLDQKGRFRLPIRSGRRDLETVKPKKRSLYRRRFAFLDELEESISKRFSSLKPVSFRDT